MLSIKESDLHKYNKHGIKKSAAKDPEHGEMKIAEMKIFP